MTTKAIKTTTKSPKWCNIYLVLCSIQNFMQLDNSFCFATQLKNHKRNRPIKLEMVNLFYIDLWKEIGISHLIEILHQALILSETLSTPFFFNNSEKKFLLPIKSLFEIAKSPEYLQWVLVNYISKLPFSFPLLSQYIT